MQQGAELVPYLDALGVGAVYASPLLASGAGSTTATTSSTPPGPAPRAAATRGGAALAAAARARGLGFLLDIVPNHVGVDDAEANPWWWDVLTHGRALATRVLRHRLGGGPILLPVLGAEPTRTTRRR